MSRGGGRTTLGKIVTLRRGFELPVELRRLGSVPIIAASGPVGFHDEARVQGPGVVIGWPAASALVQFISSDFWPLKTTLYASDFLGVEPRFVAFLLESILTGSSVSALDLHGLHSVEVVVPPLEEQRCIATLLSAIDASMTCSAAVVGELESVKEAVSEEVLDVAGIDVKLASLGEVADITVGRSFASADWPPNGMPVIQGENLRGSSAYHNFAGAIEPRYIAEPGDILMSAAGTPCLWSGRPGIIGQYVYRISNLRGVNKQFLFHVLGAAGVALRRRVVGSTGIMRLSKGQLEEVKVPVPSEDQQHRLAALLSSIDSAIEQAVEEARRLAEFKRAVGQELLGRLQCHHQEGDETV